MRSDLKKLDSFTLETSKNHLIRNFLRNGCVRVKDPGSSEKYDFTPDLKYLMIQVSERSL